MKIVRIRAVYFSPCGTVETMTRTIAEGLSMALDCPSSADSCTLPMERTTIRDFTPDELVVTGFPTYAGKLPNKLLPWLQTHLQGGGALAIPIVLFGNRSYDNALSELCAILETHGFHTIAAAAFASRHVFSRFLAADRPSPADLSEAEHFAGAVAERIQNMEHIPSPVCVPGDANAPYYVPHGVHGERTNFLKAKPKVERSKCTRCGLCARVCPMGAIDPQDVLSVPGVCIKCHACIRRCPQSARYFDDPAFLSHVTMLEQTFHEPKANCIFF